MKNGEAFFREAAMLVSLFSLCLFATDKPSDSKAQEASEVVNLRRRLISLSLISRLKIFCTSGVGEMY